MAFAERRGGGGRCGARAARGGHVDDKHDAGNGDGGDLNDLLNGRAAAAHMTFGVTHHECDWVVPWCVVRVGTGTVRCVVLRVFFLLAIRFGFAINSI